MPGYRRSGGGRRGARADRRIVAVTAMLALASGVTACGGSSKPHAAPTTATTSPATSASPTTTPTSSAPGTGTSTTIDSPIGAQAFRVYQQAFALLDSIEKSPRGVSTDPRLAQIMIDPWYGEVRVGIDQLRLKSEVAKGTYGFSKFRLNDVTPDGRIIFTDCEVQNEDLYSAKTGAQLTHYGSQQTPEQIVVYHPAAGIWKVADRNTGTAGAAHGCDA